MLINILSKQLISNKNLHFIQNNNVNVVEILVERLPSSYELRNLKYSSWQNVTIEKKIVLGIKYRKYIILY